MTRFTVIPHRLFHRTWRSGHPFCPRLGRMRRVAMLLLLLFFSLIIGGYNYLTDAVRVRGMAQTYLSKLVGGRVEINSATLSIFDGLRVDGVRVYVDPAGTNAPDSLIFSAQAFVLKYDPRQLLAGELQASQIIAQKPRVYLCENLDQPGEWNFHRIGRGRMRRLPSPKPDASQNFPLPEVLLRNARVDIYELKGETLKNVGFMAIDGQLTPSGAGSRYQFEMQGRGTDGVGPYASGEVSVATQSVKAELHNFDFNRDLRLMPREVREWCLQHGLHGLFDVPELSYMPPRGPTPAAFRVEVILRGVMLGLRPDEITSAHKDPPSSQSPASITGSTSITLQNGSGSFVFTESGILLKDVQGTVENNSITLNGHIDGYAPNSPVGLVLASADGHDIYFPPDPQWVRSLPTFVQDVYQDLHPTGTCKVLLHIDRTTPSGTPTFSGRVDVIDGNINYRNFPYPVNHATGTVTFGAEPHRGGDFVKIINFRVPGMKGGPNEKNVVVADGEIGPLGPDHPDPQVKIIASSDNLSSEPALIAAYPPEISHALSIFDAGHTGVFPQYRGSFKLALIHLPGGRWTYDTDVDLADASGRIQGFPYPLEHVAGRFHVRDGYVDLDTIAMRQGEASIEAAGRVVWGEGGVRVRKLGFAPLISQLTRQGVAEPPEKMDLRLRVRGVPINGDLVNAIPPEHRYWLGKLGIGGTLDADGRITLGIQDGMGLVGPARLIFPQWMPRPFRWKPEQINFAMDMTLRNGTFWPADGTFSVSEVAGRLRLSRDGMEIQSIAGRRGASVLTADGSVQWASGSPAIFIHATGKNLPLDSSLFRMLPDDARHAWDEVQPVGALDADVTWRGEAPAGASNANKAGLQTARETTPLLDKLPAPPVSAAESGAVATIDDVIPVPTSQPTSLSGFYAILKPAGLSCTIKSLPYRLEDISGSIVIDRGTVILNDITAHHGPAKVSASGTGTLEGLRPIWDIRLSGTDVVVDDEFRKSVPPTLRAMIESVNLRGKVDFDFSKLLYRGEQTGATSAGVVQNGDPAGIEGSGITVTPVVQLTRESPAQPAGKSGKTDKARKSSPPTPRPSIATTPGGPDIVLTSTILLHDGAIEAGVPLEKIDGRIALNALVREGKLFKLDGDLDIASFRMAGREITHFKAALSKPQGSAELNLDKMQATVADGQFAGQLHLVLPDEGAQRYTLGLVLRNADIKSLVGDSDKDLRGDLTASVSLEGAFGQTTMRRGRGDVNITGRELYRMPLILGLLQVTNLSLPIGSPFNQGIARYSVEGQRVTFERIELKSDNMLMAGGGYLDFGTRQVRMNFATDNPGGFKIPFVKDLWQGARQELFKISIKGSIAQPRVEANPFGTVTTTIDEVFHGDASK